MATDIIGSSAAPDAPGQTLWQTTGTVALSTSAGVTPTLTFTGNAVLPIPAGKTLYITDIFIGASTAAQFPVTILFNGVAIFNHFAKGDTAPLDLAGIETQPQAAGDGTHEIVLTFGQATIAGTASWYIAGYAEGVTMTALRLGPRER